MVQGRQAQLDGVIFQIWSHSDLWL